MSDLDLDIALRRMTNRLKKQAAATASSAAAGAVGEASDAAQAAIDTHADQRQFVHGVGPLYVAKTSRPDQFVDWKDLRGIPPSIGGSVDPSTIEIDGEQITTGKVPLPRLPVAAPGEVTAKGLVRADDPRLTIRTFSLVTSEYVAAGDFICTHEENGQTRARRANAAFTDPAGAIGFVVEAAGAGDLVTIFPVGENPVCYLPGATIAHINHVVYLSTTPGKVSLTPPSTPGLLLQPLGSIVGIVSSTVAIVLVRYEFRFRL